MSCLPLTRCYSIKTYKLRITCHDRECSLYITFSFEICFKKCWNNRTMIAETLLTVSVNMNTAKMFGYLQSGF